MTLSVSAPSILDAHGVDPERARVLLSDALHTADDGELFLEQSESESFVFDDGRLKSATYDATEGFGLRVVAGESAGYAHSADISEGAIARAGQAARLARCPFGDPRSGPCLAPAAGGGQEARVAAGGRTSRRGGMGRRADAWPAVRPMNGS